MTRALAVGTSTCEGSATALSSAAASTALSSTALSSTAGASTSEGSSATGSASASCSEPASAWGASKEASTGSTSEAEAKSASSEGTLGAETTGSSPVEILSSIVGLSGAAPGTRPVKPPIATDSISPVLMGSLASPMIAAASEPSPGSSISSPVRTTLSRASFSLSRWTSNSFSDMLPPYFCPHITF